MKSKKNAKAARYYLSDKPSKATHASKNGKGKIDFGEVVEDLKFSRRNLYPWNVWTDGKARRLTRGTHFEGSTETMATAAYARGRKLRKDGKTVEVSCHVEDKDHIVVQFRFGKDQGSHSRPSKADVVTPRKKRKKSKAAS